MIKSVGQMIGSPVELSKLREGGRAKAVAEGDTSVSEAADSAPATPASRMAAEGAPVDMERVAAIKAAISSGNYPVNADKIAERMIALDLPGQD